MTDEQITEILRRNRDEILGGAPAHPPLPGLTEVEPSTEPPPLDYLAHSEVTEAISLRFGLTPRESQVLSGVLLGHSNMEIAQSLHIKLRTAKTHVEHIWDKTGIHSRAKLMGKLFGSEPWP